MAGTATIGHVIYGAGGGDGLGTVTNYAGLSIGLSGMRTLDTSLGDTPVRTTGGVGIKQRLTRASDNSIISDISLPWDEDPTAVFDEGVTGVDTWGYYNGLTTAAGANNYFALDQYITFEAGRTTYAGIP